MYQQLGVLHVYVEDAMDVPPTVESGINPAKSNFFFGDFKQQAGRSALADTTAEVNDHGFAAYLVEKGRRQSQFFSRLCL